MSKRQTKQPTPLSNLESMLLYQAIRYAMSRQTGASLTAVYLIREGWIERMSDNDREGIVRDMRDRIREHARYMATIDARDEPSIYTPDRDPFGGVEWWHLLGLLDTDAHVTVTTECGGMCKEHRAFAAPISRDGALVYVTLDTARNRPGFGAYIDPDAIIAIDGAPVEEAAQ